MGPAWIALGIVIYYTYSRRKTTVTEEEVVVLREEPLPNKRNYRVLVAIANPANAVQLAWQSYRFCQAKRAEVEVIHMVPVPPQLPLSDASRSILAGEEAITEAMLYLSAGFTFGSTMRYCRNIARGIISAAAEQRTDLLIMGWRGYRRRGFALGSTVDPVLEQAPCNIVVLKNYHQQKYRRVLVPFAGGPNSAFALEVASILVERKGGRIVVFHISPPGKPTQDIEAFLKEVVPSLGRPSSLFEPGYAISRDLLPTLLKEAKHYELVVMGATRERLFHQVVMGTLPEQFARHYEKPLAMVKASNPVKSLLQRWI
ncbi:MAG: universal stress protein [Candidatus Aerophobetes bacterium]|nr:universal stress protein [Candidatus Aerophobetes bacterium]